MILFIAPMPFTLPASCDERAGRGLECVERMIERSLGTEVPGWHASGARNCVVGSLLRSSPLSPPSRPHPANLGASLPLHATHEPHYPRIPKAS